MRQVGTRYLEKGRIMTIYELGISEDKSVSELYRFYL